ncbi:MAG: cupin-like domain-containing protein [Chitinophagales bacterium]
MIKASSKPSYAQTTLNTLDRRDHLSKKELIREYIEPGIPVILTDAAKDWEAMGKITPQFIKEKYGQFRKEVNGIGYSFAELIDLVLASTPDHPAPYPFNCNIEYYFPELRKLAKPEIVYGKIDRVNHPLLPRFMFIGTEPYELFIGGNGASFPWLHIDALFLHNSLTQVFGAKDFILYSPDQARFMYPRLDNPKLSQVNVLKPDYEKFPLFKEARPIKVTVNQGDTILFPTGWWHVTQIHEPCISLGRIQLNGSNWNNYVDDAYSIWKKKLGPAASLIWLYGRALGVVMDIQEKIF